MKRGSTTIFVDVNNYYHRKQISHRQLAVRKDKDRTPQGVVESGREAPTFNHPNKPAKALSFRVPSPRKSGLKVK